MQKKRTFKEKLSKLITISCITLCSAPALAEELDKVTKASNWIVSTLISCVLGVLGMQIIYSLWQVNQGQKEPSEVVRKVIITAIICSVPVIGTLIKAVLS